MKTILDYEIPKKKCIVCGRTFPTAGRNKTCSPACLEKLWSAEYHSNRFNKYRKVYVSILSNMYLLPDFKSYFEAINFDNNNSTIIKKRIRFILGSKKFYKDTYNYRRHLKEICDNKHDMLIIQTQNY